MSKILWLLERCSILRLLGKDAGNCQLKVMCLGGQDISGSLFVENLMGYGFLDLPYIGYIPEIPTPNSPKGRYTRNNAYIKGRLYSSYATEPTDLVQSNFQRISKLYMIIMVKEMKRKENSVQGVYQFLFYQLFYFGLYGLQIVLHGSIAFTQYLMFLISF